MSVSNMSAFNGATPATAPRQAAVRNATPAASLLWRILNWPGKVIEARATMRLLAGMSVHELRDIGLSPQDVNDASGLPLDADPSRFLAGRAAAGRRMRVV